MRNKKLWIFLAFGVAVLLCSYCFGWAEWFTDPDALVRLRNLVETQMVLAMVLYLLLTVVGCVILALPGVTFALAAGLLFGPLWGTLACWLAVTAGACVSFLVGRYFLKESLKPKLAKHPALNRLLFQGAESSDVFLLAVTRLIPLFPYNLQNFAYGVTDIRFGPYTLYSALFLLPGTAAYTLGVSGLADPEKRLPYLLGAAVLLAAVLVASWLLKRKTVRT